MQLSRVRPGVRPWKAPDTGSQRGHAASPSTGPGTPAPHSSLSFSSQLSTLHLPPMELEREEEIEKMGEERADDDQDGGRWRQRRKGKGDQLRKTENHTTRTCLEITCPFSSPHTKPQLPQPRRSPSSITPPCKPPGLGVSDLCSSAQRLRGRMCTPSQTPPHPSRQKVARRDKLPSPQFRGG